MFWGKIANCQRRRAKTNLSTPGDKQRAFMRPMCAAEPNDHFWTLAKINTNQKNMDIYLSIFFCNLLPISEDGSSNSLVPIFLSNSLTLSTSHYWLCCVPQQKGRNPLWGRSYFGYNLLCCPNSKKVVGWNSCTRAFLCGLWRLVKLLRLLTTIRTSLLSSCWF